MWQLKGKGPKYRSMWVYDNSGGKMFVLVATSLNSKGKPYKNVEANSWQMLVKAGWKKVG